MALDDQAGIRRSIQPECAKPRAPVLPCAAGLMEMNILGHSSAQNSEQSWRQSSGSSRDHGQDSTEMGRTRLSEGLMALGVRRSTFLAEKHMQPDGGGSGGVSGWREWSFTGRREEWKKISREPGNCRGQVSRRKHSGGWGHGARDSCDLSQPFGSFFPIEGQASFSNAELMIPYILIPGSEEQGIHQI